MVDLFLYRKSIIAAPGKRCAQQSVISFFPRGLAFIEDHILIEVPDDTFLDEKSTDTANT